MGAKVVALEKRNSFTRNNVLHLWPFVIEDLKMLGVKVFFPKFCTGSMNHISEFKLREQRTKVVLPILCFLLLSSLDECQKRYFPL